MKNIAPLQKQAVEAAKQGKWPEAIELNQEILQENPCNISALNRLALAQMQLSQIEEAKETLCRVLELDKLNKIALKNLEKAKRKQKGKVAQFNQCSSYIEEPGKAKVIDLIRLADDKSLKKCAVGQECTLDPKSSFISINIADNSSYLGTLPKEISTRLINLINSGNEYGCVIHSIEPDQEKCKVYIEELKVSSKNLGKTSFPITLETEYQDPEIISLEHELKNNLPIDYESDNDDEDIAEEDKQDNFEDANKSLLSSSIQDDNEEDE